MTEVQQLSLGQGPLDHEQPQPEQRQRKRRRRTQACTQCRSRKLRCDREYPTCGRCLKSKTPSACTYEDNNLIWQQPSTVASNVFSDRGSTGTLPIIPQADRTPVHTPPDSGITALPPRAPEPTASETERPCPPKKKDHFLETVLGAPKAGVNQEPYVNTELLHRTKRTADSHRGDSPDQLDEQEDGIASPTQQLDLSPRIMMRGKETKTRFNGSGILANLMTQFRDIKPFAEEIRLSSPHLAHLRPDLERVKKGLWKRVPLNDPFPAPTTASLIGLVPNRGVVDELIILYLTYVESTYRIFHVPSFLKELDEFWAQRDNPDLASPAFVVQLLLVCACAWNLADFDTLQYKNELPLKCYTAVEWILHTEKWLQNAHIKRPEVTSLRMYVLLITAQNSFGMKRSHAWLSTGTLVRQGMLAGYHRDPSRYTKISAFNKEMRRRIWTTIVELDLQVSFDRGMPPSIQFSDYDTTPPSNLNDADMSETIPELPESKPLNEVTDTSFQAILAQSLELRSKICALMHSPRISCRYDEILRLDWELNRQLSKIPAWQISDFEDFQTQHKVALMKAMLETKISHALLTLHTPFSIEAPKEPLFAPSARARLDAATMILSIQRRLHETSRQLSLCIMGDWTIHACCTICQLLHGGSDGRASSSTFLARTLLGFPETLLTLVETVLLCLEARLLLVVKGAKEFFFMSTILALVKARLWPAQANVYKQEVVERVILFAQTLFTRHASCSHLGNPGMGSFKTNQIPSLTPTSGIAPMAPSFNGILQPANFGITPPGEFDPFLDVFDWEDLTGIAFDE